MKRSIFLTAFIVITNLGFGQFKNIQLDVGEEGLRKRPTEPSVAINLKDSKNIVVGAGINHVYYTMDGGENWSKSTLTSPHGVFGDPVIISDHKGNFYYYHLADPTGENYESEEFLSGIVVQESGDKGATWSEGVLIGVTPKKDHDKPWAAIDRKNNLVVSWTEFDKYGSDDPNCYSRILFSQSSNGKKWSKPVVISQLDGDCKDDDNTPMGAVPVVNDGGQIFLAWANQSKIFIDRSFDGGTTWLRNDIKVEEQVGGWNFDIPGLKRCNGLPVLGIDNANKSRYHGALYLAWSDQRNGSDNSDIWFTRSMNFGDNWTTPIKIAKDEGTGHQFLPWLTVDQSNGYIYIVFYDRSEYNDNRTDVMLAYSVDAGASFEEVKISEQPFEPSNDVFFGDYINISASKGVIVPVWTRMDNGVTSIWTAVIKHSDLVSGK